MSFDNSNNRNSSELRNSLICNGLENSYTLVGSCTDESGVCDSGLLAVTNDADGQKICFFKAVLNVCIVDNAIDCDQVTDGRYANHNTNPHVKIWGVVTTCNSFVSQQSSILLFPASGQTLVELKESILILIGRNCD